MKHLALTAALCVAGLFISSLAHSQSAALSTPRTITFQGSLRQTGGKFVKDSTYSVTVRLYSDEAGTREVWRGTYAVQTMGGVFNIALGSGDSPFPQAADMDKALWLGVQVEGNDEMRPLSAMSASAYALNVPDKSISAEKISADYIRSLTINGQKITGNGRDLNIQTGDGLLASIDEATNSVLLKSAPSLAGVKGGQVEGNTTISGSLTVTGTTILGTGGSTPVYIRSLTAGSVPFIGSSGLVAQDNSNLFWDNTNKRLGIGTSSPGATLDVSGDVTLGANSSNTFAVNGRVTTSIIPQTDNVVNLGDATHWWSNIYATDLHLGPHSLTMSDGSIETQMTMPTGDGGAFAINFYDVTGPSPVLLSDPLTPPLQIDQYGMVTTDLQTDAITSGMSIKIDGTNYPRTIQSDDDINIYINPTLDGAVNAPGTPGKKIQIYAGVGGDGAIGGDLVLASGAAGAGGPNAGTIYFKTSGTGGTEQMHIDENGVTINSALFTTGTFSTSAITPILYGGTQPNSTLSLLTTNNALAPTGSITLGGSTGAGTTTFATMNANSVNLGSGVALKTNGTTRISTSGDATFTTLSASGTTSINDANANDANTSINTTSGAGEVAIGNAATYTLVTGSTEFVGNVLANANPSTSYVELGNVGHGGNVSLYSHDTVRMQAMDRLSLNAGNATGVVEIGNSSDAGDITVQTPDTISVTGTTQINTSGTSTTDIGNTTGATTMYGQLVNSYAKDTATYNNTDAVNEVTLLNRSVNYIWGDANFVAGSDLVITVPDGVDGQIMTVVDVADNSTDASFPLNVTFVDSNQVTITSTAFSGGPTKFELVHADGSWIVF